MSTESMPLAPERGALEGYLEALLGPAPPVAVDGASAAHGTAMLVVRAGGVAVALPERAVEATLPWPDRPARPPQAAPPWLAGRVRHGRAWLPVADLAALILPPGRRTRLAEPAARLRWLLLVEAEGARWGLGCEAVAEPVRLAAESLQPRAPDWPEWLAATVPARRLLVLDVRRLVERMSREAGTDTA